MPQSRFSSQRASRSMPAGCASRGAPRASREILRRRKAVRLPSMLNLLCLVSRLPFFLKAILAPARRERASVEGSWHKSKSLPKDYILLVWGSNLAAAILPRLSSAGQVRLGYGSRRLGKAGFGCPRRARPFALPRAPLRIPPSAARAIGKQLFSTSFSQLKGRKNKKLPQLVKIFLDTQLPP